MTNDKRCAINGAIIGMMIILTAIVPGCEPEVKPSVLQRLKYNNPGLQVDLGVGLWAWPLPMDYDGDGDYDLLVSCPDVPYNGIHFFENKSGNVKYPVFAPPLRIADGERNIQPSYVNNQIHLLIPGKALVDFKKTDFKNKVDIYPTEKIHEGKTRANQWKYCDYEDDGDLDIIVGIGDWNDYGWDNAFNKNGRWTRGPLHGYIYLIRNNGRTAIPDYAEPEMIAANGKPIDVFGMPSPNFVDFDGDGDLDLLCGEFVDRFTYFENTGSRKEPKYSGGKILTYQNEPLTMDLEMIVPVAIDWDKDGDVDLVVGQEDGRVALVENTGRINEGVPQFLPPLFFQQYANELKFGALVTPFSYDWDHDGDEDLICGNTAGYIGFIENLDGNDPPRWAHPQYLEVDNKPIRIQAGYNGSIQGPCEAKWGYTTLNIADWDHDGLPDLIINSIWGKVLWFKNTGSLSMPNLSPARPLIVEWPGKAPKPAWFWWDPPNGELATQWRTTPVVIDWNHDRLNDLIILDHEGYLSFFERVKKDQELILVPGERIFLSDGSSVFDGKHRPQNEVSGMLQLNGKTAGGSGRRKFCFVDWDLDGQLDLLVNSRNVNFMRGMKNKNTAFTFKDMGEVDTKTLAGHTTSPTIVDWDKNGIPDLLIGAEDGYFYYMKNPYEH
jgi:hypothetical protein